MEVEFKPVHKIKLNKTSGGEQTGKAEVLQTTPPPIIIDLCYGPDHSYICYYWELDRVLLRSHLGGAPVIIAYLDSIDGDYIRRVDLTNDITLTRSEHRWISFELALTFLRTVKFIAPGPGYYREISSGLNSEKLFSLACTFYNSKLSNELSDCNYMGDQGFTPYPRNFYGEALLAIGFRGYMWLVEYKYIERRYDGEKVIDRSLAVYLVPLFNSRGKIEYWYDVDDNPYDGRGMLEKVFWNITTNQYVKSVRFPSFTGTSWRVISYDVKVSSNSPAAFGIAIPVGALAVLARGGVLPSPWSAVVSAVFALTVGVAVSVAGESEFYMNFATAYFLATQSVTFAPRYYHVDKSYMVKEAGGEYRVPFMIVQPFVY